MIRIYVTCFSPVLQQVQADLQIKIAMTLWLIIHACIIPIDLGPQRFFSFYHMMKS